MYRIMDSIIRASAKDYTPTWTDHRRFSKDRRHVTIDDTFHFPSDPVSVNILDPVRLLRSCGKAKQMGTDFCTDASSLVFLVDLLQVDGRGDQPSFEDSIRYYLKPASEAIRRGKVGALHTSFIVIFFNVAGFQEKLRHSPFSESHASYVGSNSLKPVVNFMVKRLLSECHGTVRVYPYVGELDAACLKFILAAVKESMLQRALKESGLF